MSCIPSSSHSAAYTIVGDNIVYEPLFVRWGGGQRNLKLQNCSVDLNRISDIRSYRLNLSENPEELLKSVTSCRTQHSIYGCSTTEGRPNTKSSAAESETSSPNSVRRPRTQQCARYVTIRHRRLRSQGRQPGSELNATIGAGGERLAEEVDRFIRGNYRLSLLRSVKMYLGPMAGRLKTLKVS